MKQKITIGLLVFFLGILITACGSKKNNNDGDDPGDYGYFDEIRRPDDCNRNCSRSVSGVIHIEDKDEYANAFLPGLDSGWDYANHDDNRNRRRIDLRDLYDHPENVLDAFTDRFLNTIVNGVIDCGAGIMITKILEEIFNADDVRMQCDIAIDRRRDYDNLRDSYDVTVQFEFDSRTSGNGIEAIILDVDRDGDRDILEFDDRDSDHIFYTRNRNYMLEIDRDRLHIVNRRTNEQMGYITR